MQVLYGIQKNMCPAEILPLNLLGTISHSKIQLQVEHIIYGYTTLGWLLGKDFPSLCYFKLFIQFSPIKPHGMVFSIGRFGIH